MNLIVSREQYPNLLFVKRLSINPSYKSMHGNWWSPCCKSPEYTRVFKRNFKDGSIDNDKTKLVVEGYKQKGGMDDLKTYSLEYDKLKNNGMSRCTSNSMKGHWKVIVKILRYLRYTLNYGLHYTKYPFVLREYNDVNWISVTKNTKSMSGYVFVFGSADVSWKPTKQTCIARSTQWN